MQSDRFWALEGELAALVRGRVTNASAGLAPTDAVEAALAAAQAVAGAPPLSEEQRAAVRAALTQPLTLVAGGPGTGKTSIVVALLRVLVRLGVPAEGIALAAPTGRAAQRMKESVDGALAHLAGPDAADAALDRQGRILIPQNLREYAGLGDQVIVAGLNTHFEIWSTERWNDVLSSLDSSASGIAEQLAALGI